MSDSLQPCGLQHAKLPCPSLSPRVCSNSCPLSQWFHPTISFSVVPFFSWFQSFPASRSFPMSQFFASGGQSIGVSASTSVLPMNIQNWFPLGLTGWISLQSKGLSRVFYRLSRVFKRIYSGWSQFFFPEASVYLISRLQSASAVILEPPIIKSVTVSIATHLFAMKWWDQMPWS